MKNSKPILFYILLMIQVLAVSTATSCLSAETSNDLDGDGVTEKNDICPDTPRDVKVDKDGCPVDEDGDNVPDYQDQNPEEAGTAALTGSSGGDSIGSKVEQ